MPQGDDWRQSVRQIGLLTSIPMILVGGPLIGFLVGRWVDVKFDTDPYGKLALIFYGFFGSVREVIRIVKMAGKDR